MALKRHTQKPETKHRCLPLLALTSEGLPDSHLRPGSTAFSGLTPSYSSGSVSSATLSSSRSPSFIQLLANSGLWHKGFLLPGMPLPPSHLTLTLRGPRLLPDSTVKPSSSAPPRTPGYVTIAVVIACCNLPVYTLVPLPDSNALRIGLGVTCCRHLANSRILVCVH